MALTTAQQALQVPGAEVRVLALVKPRDPANSDALVTIGIANDSWWTEPDDSLPSMPFRGLLAEGSSVQISEHLTSAGQVTGPSSIGRNDLTIDVGSGAQAAWRDLDWNGSEITIYVGAKLRADGQRMVFSEFDALITGVIDRADALGDAQWEIRFADPRAELAEPITAEFYRGFGGAYRLVGDGRPSGERTHLTSTGDGSTTIEGPLTLEVIGRLVTSSVTKTTLLRVRDFEIFLDATRKIGMSFHLDGTTETFTSSYEVSEGDPFYAALRVGSDDQSVQLTAGKTGDDLSTVLDETLSAALVSGVFDSARIGSVDAGVIWDVWEARLWSVELADADLEESADGPVTDASDRTDLIEVWRFSEGVDLGLAAIAFGDKGAADLDAGGAGDPTWVSSLEGDDPDLFGGSPAGQTKAATWGPAQNVQLVPLDSQRPSYGWHLGAHESGAELYLSELRHGGVPMVRKHAVVSLYTGELVFDATANTITLTTDTYSPTGDFRLFIAGQRDPARLGQRVLIANTASNDGIARVAVDGISADGLVLTVVDKDLVDETALANARVDTLAADEQYEAFEDADPPRVELPSMPEADLTADFELTGAALQWSALHAIISGKTASIPPGDDQYNPSLSYHLKVGDDTSKRDALDALARAAFGWWIENSSGGHDLGTWEPPSGSPVATLTTDRIIAVEPIRSVLPRGRFEIAHTPIWHQQSGDALARSVSAGDRKRWSNPFSVRPVADRRIRDTRFPLSGEIPRLETYLVSDAAVTQYAGLAKPFFCREGLWYRIMLSLWGLFIVRNDVVEVSWDDEDLELDSTLCRVTGRRVDVTAGTVELEVFWLKEEPT